MKAIDKVRQQMGLDIAPCREYVGGATVLEDGSELWFFDPWEIFPAIYGSYSSAFDDMAIKVLNGLAAKVEGDYGYWPDTLAEEMFQEMLCKADLCDYGTSPRSCFATEEFAELLPAFVGKWEEYRSLVWGETA